MSDELVDRSALELSGMIADGTVSSVEVVAAHLDRIALLEPSVHALISQLPDDVVLAEAARKDQTRARDGRTGWMHGLPHAVKDLADLRGLPTTLGLRRPESCPSAADDEAFVARIRDAGAVFVGKSNTSELGVGSHTYNQVAPATGNVVDPARSAGGSSGGAAVAVASGMVPVADGSDFMGSLRNPPGWNGVLGMRPSPGVVLDRGDDPADPGFGVNGPIARTVDDLRALLATMAGPAVDLDVTRPEPAGSPRVGWLTEVTDALPFAEGVLQTCRTAAGRWGDVHDVALSCGGASISVDELWRTWLTIRHDSVGGWVASAFDDDEIAATKPEVQWEVAGFERLTDRLRSQAVAHLESLRTVVRAMFANVDLVMLPTAQVWPFPAEQTWPREIAGVAMDTYHRWMEITTFATLAGLPVVAVPAGRNADGLDIGLQVIGRPGGDAGLLSWVSWAEQQEIFSVRPPTSVIG